MLPSRASALLLGLATACSTTTAASPDATVLAPDAAVSTPDAAGATDASTPDALAATPDVAPRTVSPLIAARPYGSIVPPHYDPATPTPLVILLHGYSASGTVQATYLGIDRLARSRGFLLAYPDGTFDSHGNRFWNATDGCCNFDGSPVDDVAYVSAVIADMRDRFNVDPHRIFMMGHSNGGFMSYRFACDHGDQIAAFVSLAGANWLDASRCTAATPVPMVEIHGTTDNEVLYDGQLTGEMQYPGVHDSIAKWVTVDGCDPVADTSDTLDMDSTVAGSETHVARAPHCTHGAVELWTMQGVGHLPIPSATFGNSVYDWMLAHARE